MVEYRLIERRRLFEKVVDQMEDLIFNNKHKAGDKLPPEQALAEQFGVSRNVIREAYKSLMERGLVVVLQGRGTFVTIPTPNPISNALNRFIRRSEEKDSYSKLYEVRRVLELAIAGLAAERAEEKDLRAMERAIKSMKEKSDSAEEWAKADLEFHSAMAEATYNQLFLALLIPITTQLLESFLAGFNSPNVVESALRCHHNLVESIRAKDAEGAKKAMLDHLKDSEIRVKLVSGKLSRSQNSISQ